MRKCRHQMPLYTSSCSIFLISDCCGKDIPLPVMSSPGQVVLRCVRKHPQAQTSRENQCALCQAAGVICSTAIPNQYIKTELFLFLLFSVPQGVSFPSQPWGCVPALSSVCGARGQAPCESISLSLLFGSTQL